MGAPEPVQEDPCSACRYGGLLSRAVNRHRLRRNCVRCASAVARCDVRLTGQSSGCQRRRDRESLCRGHISKGLAAGRESSCHHDARCAHAVPAAPDCLSGGPDESCDPVSRDPGGHAVPGEAYGVPASPHLLPGQSSDGMPHDSAADAVPEDPHAVPAEPDRLSDRSGGFCDPVPGDAGGDAVPGEAYRVPNGSDRLPGQPTHGVPHHHSSTDGMPGDPHAVSGNSAADGVPRQCNAVPGGSHFLSCQSTDRMPHDSAADAVPEGTHALPA